MPREGLCCLQTALVPLLCYLEGLLPCSIQGFHTSLTHFSLPGFLLTGHKLSRGRGGLRSEKQKKKRSVRTLFQFVLTTLSGIQNRADKVEVSQAAVRREPEARPLQRVDL